MSKFMSNQVNEAFNGNSFSQITVDKNKIGSADAALIIDKKKRAGFLTRALVSQAGGYDPQYYTKDEAKSSTVLAVAKFASVTLATYSFMKAVYPVFENHAITTLPSVGNVDTKYILAGTAAGALWWGISKLDTAVMHGMRSQKAAKYAETHLEINKRKTQKSTWPGLLFRFGISAGSLGISIPALLVTASEGTINEYIKNNTNAANAPIVAENQERLSAADRYIGELRNKGVNLQTALLDLQVTNTIITDAQRKRLEALSELLSSMQRQKEQEESRRMEQMRIRDEATSRMNQEQSGTRGSVAGEGPLFRNAQADRDDANRLIGTIEATLSGINTGIAETTAEMTSVNQQVESANQARQTELEKQRANINKQLEQIQTDIQAQTKIRDDLADVNALAARDPRYKHFNPDLAEQVDAYIDYMSNEANMLDWSRAGFMALMIVCMELGVFALASSRQLSPGEVRGHLAEVIKSREAGDVFNKIIEVRKLIEEVGTDDNIVGLRKMRRIMEVDEQNFNAALEKLKNDPDLRDQAFEDVLKAYKEFDIKTEHAKATDVRGPGSSVSQDEQENSTAHPAPNKKKSSDPSPS